MEAGGVVGVMVVGVSLLCWWWWWRGSPRLPPSPRGRLPLIGHLHLLDRDPRRQFREWRRELGDVFSVYMGGRAVVVLNGLPAVKDALVRRADVFSHRPDTFAFTHVCRGRGLTGSSGAQFKEQRKASLEILRELGMGKVTLADRVQEEVTHYVKALHSRRGEAADMSELTRLSVSNNVCSILFGRRFQYDDPEFLRYLAIVGDNLKAAAGTAALNFFPWLRHLPGDVFHVRKVADNAKNLHDTFLRPQLDRHLHCARGEEGEEGGAEEGNGDGGEGPRDFIDAYLSRMMRLRRLGHSTSLSEENLTQLLADLFFAGSETTATALTWTVAFLLHHPEVQETCHALISRVMGTRTQPRMRDRAEMTYVEATIMESLRLARVAPFTLQHGLARGSEFRGYELPADAIVLPSLESVLLDPDLWPDPLNFDPGRFISPDGQLLRPEEFIPFGIGRRVCIGEPLARMELFLYLTNMIRHFRFLPPEDGQFPSLNGILGMTHAPEPFKVRFCARENEHSRTSDS